jgi:hypothetical protein
MAKSSKSAFEDMFTNDKPKEPAAPIPERDEDTAAPTGPGRPRGKGKRNNPAYRQYTMLLRHENHDNALRKLQQTTLRPDFGEFVDRLIAEWLEGK